MNPAAAGRAGTQSVVPVTFSAHRLWISMWTFLGRPEDNSGETGDNCGGTVPGPAAVHTPSPARPAGGTAAVDPESRRHLRERLLSPESTVPMTATTSCLSERTTSEVTRGDQRTGPEAEGFGARSWSRPGHTRRPGCLKPARAIWAGLKESRPAGVSEQTSRAGDSFPCLPARGRARHCRPGAGCCGWTGAPAPAPARTGGNCR